MAKKRYNVVFGEKYGDVNDPKTAWKKCGTLFVDEEDGRMSIKLDMVPVGPAFKGWLSVFEPRDDQDGGQRRSRDDSGKIASGEMPDSLGDDPINLDDIPF